MQVSKEIKELAKRQRLQQLERRYFELELDKISLEAIGNLKDAELVAKRMEDLKKAYEAVKAFDMKE